MTVVLLALIFAACSEEQSEPEREQRQLLGTSTVITIYDSSIPDDAFDRYFERVEEIQNRMSSNEEEYDDTEILSINRNAGVEPVEVSDDTFFVVSEGKRWGEITDGLFDMSVLPLLRLWDIGGPDEQVPSEAEREEALSLVNYEEIELDDSANTVYLPREGMGIDVGGIAKGYAVDEITAMMREDGIERAIIDFGGDLYSIGSRPDGTRWRIGIQHPSGNRQQILSIINSSDEAVVTSGPYERYFEQDGKRYHHILDPRTGAPSDNGLVSTTVVGPDAIGADVLSTAAFVMGLPEGYELIEEREDYEAVFADDEDNVYATSGIRDDVDVRAEEFEMRESNPAD
ncbi:MAG: FAD:protein FMN transferase [Spirochaetales bacterium]